MKWRPFLLPKPRHLVAGIALLTGLPPIAGWIGGGFWPLDLCNHFQVQYAVVLSFTTAVLLGLKSVRLAILSAGLLAVPLARIVPAHLPPGGPEAAGPSVKVCLFNVFVSNHRHVDTLRWVKAEAPDFIYFTETTESWARKLESLRVDYPHSIEEGSGFAFYSKLPINSHEIIRCSDIEFPLLVARIATPNGEVTFFGVHPLPPVSRHWSKALEETMADLAREVAKANGPVIVAGDFNASRWSHRSRPLERAGLMDASRGKAPGATWMRSNPLVAIPIDRVLFRGPRMECRRFEIGPELGSDHRPVVAEIAW